MRHNKVKAFCATAVLLGVMTASRSEALMFHASQIIGGYDYAASATFTLDATNHILSISLTNTAPNPIANQGQGLSGIYFDVLGAPSISKNSAQLPAGSTIVNDTPNLNDAKIGREWAFRNNLGAAELNFTDARYGISSTGLGAFNAANRFDTSGNLAGPGNGAVAGDDFDIVPASQVSFTGGGLTGTPFIQHEMLFRLNVPTGFALTPNSIQNVAFHYGSGQEFTTLHVEQNPVPEPGAIALLAASGIPLTLLWRRRRK